MPITHSATILCVDDDANILFMFERTLGKTHNVLTAQSGEQALNVLAGPIKIAVIISDYQMPGMDGIELLKRALDVSPDTVQIILTGNLDIDVSIQAINETAIFRYLPKPCPTAILQKVVADALAQYHLVIDKCLMELELKQKNLQLAASNAQLEKQKFLLEYELEMAKTVYGNVVSHQYEQLDGLDYLSFPKEEVGGDFLLTYTSDDRKAFYLMFGDLTGHGLQSALAVLLVAECFERHCQSEPDIEILASDINAKMRGKLPIGLFCAAALLKLDVPQRRLTFWKGGTPDAYCLDDKGRVVKSVVSNNLPLGVCSEQIYTDTAGSYRCTDIETLFLYTDGLTEQIGTDNHWFGEHRLLDTLKDTPPDSRRIDFVVSRLRQHQGRHEQSDDISLLELNLPRICKALESYDS